MLFSVDDKDRKSWFFEKTFLLANISIDVTFGILFLTNSNLGSEICSSRKAHIASLKGDETPICIFSKYADFADVFSKNLAAKYQKHTKINDYIINLVQN